MPKRLFDDDSGQGWLPITRRCANEVTLLFADALAKVEAELGEPVDLRDFHFVSNFALGGFISDLSIRRRLCDGDDLPKPIMKHYPRLEPLDDE